MKVLGIDPGYDRLGVAVVERVDNTEQLLFSTCIETNPTDDLPTRLKVAGNKLAAILTEHQPTVVAIETLFFNKNVKTAIGVAQARGVILYLAGQAGAEILEVSPQQIKIAVTGYGKSDKQAVIDMTKRLVKGVPEDALDDEYDAIAAAVTGVAHSR